MKSLLTICSLLWICSGSVTCFGDEAADHDALRALKSVYEDSVMKNDLDALAPFLHPNFSGIMLTGERVTSLDELKSYWGKIRGMMGGGGKYTFVIEPEESVLLGEVALAKGTTQDKVVTGGGTEYSFDTAWTAVLQRTGGQWKILRIQGSMDPLTNEFVTSAVGGATTTGALLGGVAGLLLGLVGALFMRKKG